MTDDSSTPDAGESRNDGEGVARFEVRLTRLLAADGSVCGELPAFAADTDHLLRLYRVMVLTRLFDRRAIGLQRTGRLGTYASNLGQEAIGTAIGDVMRREDVLVPSYREYAALFMRGVTMTDLLLYWGGDERGMAYAGASASEDFPICVPIGTQVPHAVGVGYAFRLRRQPRVAVCVLGDGASSKGDFYEAINAAGVWRLPVVFVVANNQWAISVRRQAQSAAQTLAQKAIAAGFTGEQVDGNDLFALHTRLAAAVDNARSGGGPHLIEALTYRLGDHTTADDASRYRPKEELEENWRNEPLARLQTYMKGQGLLDEAGEESLHRECEAEVEAAVEAYLEIEPVPGAAMFDHLYADLPAVLAAQRDSLAGRERDDG